LAANTDVVVSIDGKVHKVSKSITVKSLLEKIGAPTDITVAAITKSKEEIAKLTDQFRMKTDRGNIEVEIQAENLEIWNKFVVKRGRLEVRWVTPKNVMIGSFPTDLKPSDRNVKYEAGDVEVSLAGFDPKNGHIVLIKDRHESCYAAPAKKTVFGRVISGRHLLNALRVGDSVEIEPLIKGNTYREFVKRLDLSNRITKPIDIYTHLKIKVSKENPVTAEHMFFIVRDGFIKADEVTPSFLCYKRSTGILLPQEKYRKRMRGAVTIRNSGEKSGAMFIYRDNRPPSSAHNVVGMVEEGVGILAVAQKDDKIWAKTEPRQVDCVGLTQQQAEEHLSNRHLKQKRHGALDDDATVVDQDPPSTFDAYEKHIVNTFGVKSSEILKIKIYDKYAPKTARYLRIMTGLNYRHIGRLETYFLRPEVGFILFKGISEFPQSKTELDKLLTPENTPTEIVEKNEIGVTNTASKYVGMIGVRLESSKDFGPTGEGPVGTNLVAKVISGFESLKKLKDKSQMYIMEV